MNEKQFLYKELHKFFRNNIIKMRRCNVPMQYGYALYIGDKMVVINYDLNNIHKIRPSKKCIDRHEKFLVCSIRKNQNKEYADTNKLVSKQAVRYIYKTDFDNNYKRLIDFVIKFVL